MKTLHLRLHSITDGPKNTIGPKGLVLAWHEGVEAVRKGNSYKRLFHGPLVCTAQTALAFLEAFTKPPTTMAPIFGLGDDMLFGELENDMFKKAVATGQTNLAATLMSHSSERCEEWSQMAGNAVRGMFDSMEDGETAIGFFHSPTIEMAASSLGYAVTDLRLAEMEGLSILRNDRGLLTVESIRVTEAAAAAGRTSVEKRNH